MLAVGGVLGVGAKMLAIPPQALTFDGGRRCLNLAVDTATLDAAPGFDRANPPENADGALLARAQPPRSATTPFTQLEVMPWVKSAMQSSYTVLALGLVVMIFLGALFFVQASRRGNRRFKWLRGRRADAAAATAAARAQR